MTEPTGSRPDRRRERLVIAVLAGSGMLTSLQFTLIVPVLPEIPDLLDVSANDASWMVTVTLLTGTAATPLLTRLADLHGRRRMLLVCLALLVAGSVIAAIGLTFPTVLVGRALQGSATAILPIGISLLGELTSRERANVGIALMSGTLGIGSALGLPLSGLLVGAAGLPALFWFSAIAGAAFLIAIAVIVPGSPGLARGRLDVWGALILAAGLVGALLVVSKGTVWGWTSPAILSLALGTVALFAVWFPLELRRASPVVDVRTSLRPFVLRTNIASFFAAFGMFANHLLTVQEARAPAGSGSGLGFSALGAGLTVLPAAVVMIALAPVAGHVLNRAGGRFTLAFGSAVIAGAFAFRLVFHDGLAVVIAGTLLVGVGTAFAFAAMPSLIMSAVPRDEVASANGVNSLIRSMSGAVASATFAALVVVLPGGPDAETLSEAGLMTAFAIVAGCAAVAATIALTLRRPPQARTSR